MTVHRLQCLGFALALLASVCSAHAAAVVAPRRLVPMFEDATFDDMAGDGHGTYVVVAQRGRAYVAYRSIDGGLTWSPPITVQEAPDGASYDSIVVASDENSGWVAAWNQTTFLSPWFYTTSIILARSSDDGLTWTVLPMFEPPPGDEYRNPYLYGRGAGMLLRWWEDDGSGEAVSSDGGVTWIRSDPGIGHVSQPDVRAIERSPDGVWMALFAEFANDAWRLVTRTSLDGSVWDTPRPVESASQAALAAAPGGRWMRVWLSPAPYEAYQAMTPVAVYSNDNGQSWSSPQEVFPEGGPYFSTLAGLFYDPSDDAWTVLWTASHDIAPGDLLYSRSFDNGASWSRAAQFNASPRMSLRWSVAHVGAGADAQGNLLTVFSDDDSTMLAAVSKPECPRTPSSECLESSGPSSLRVRNAVGRSDSLLWRLKIPGTEPSDSIGDPAAQTSYRMCLYEADGGTLQYERLIEPGGQCGNRPCWSTGNGSYRMKDPRTSLSSLRTVSLRHDSGMFAGVSLKAVGYATNPPALPIAGALALTMQIHNTDTGTCWSRTMRVSQNAEHVLVAR